MGDNNGQQFGNFLPSHEYWKRHQAGYNAAWRMVKSELTKKNPYKPGTPEYDGWIDGVIDVRAHYT